MVFPDLACVACRFKQSFKPFERWLSRIFRRTKPTGRTPRENKYDCLWQIWLSVTLKAKCEERGAEERNWEGLRKKGNPVQVAFRSTVWLIVVNFVRHLVVWFFYRKAILISL